MPVFRAPYWPTQNAKLNGAVLLLISPMLIFYLYANSHATIAADLSRR